MTRLNMGWTAACRCYRIYGYILEFTCLKNSSLIILSRITFYICNVQATERVAIAFLVLALLLALLPVRYIFLLVFLETFTRYSPIRRPSTERWMRRLRDWWFSIPAAPVILERVNQDKKKRWRKYDLWLTCFSQSCECKCKCKCKCKSVTANVDNIFMYVYSLSFEWLLYVYSLSFESDFMILYRFLN